MPLNINFQQILLHMFNFVILAFGLYMLLYKPVVGALRKAKLVESSGSGSKAKISVGFTIFALAVLVTFVLLFLVMIGVL